MCGSLAWGPRGDEPEAGLLETLGCGAGGEVDGPAGPLREGPECWPATGCVLEPAARGMCEVYTCVPV